MSEGIGNCKALTHLDLSGDFDYEGEPTSRLKSLPESKLAHNLAISWTTEPPQSPKASGIWYILRRSTVEDARVWSQFPKVRSFIFSLLTLYLDGYNSEAFYLKFIFGTISEGLGDCKALTNLNVRSCKRLEKLPESKKTVILLSFSYFCVNHHST